MTESKHSQEIRAGLPDKWFTLEKVAARWSKLTGQHVSVDDVLHYEEIGELRIAALVDCMLVQCPKTMNESHTKEIENKYPHAREVRASIIEKKYRLLDGIIYPLVKIAPQLREGNEVRFGFVSSSEEEIYTFDFVYIVNKRVFSSLGEGELYSDSVHRDDLRITRVERDRFEQKHGLGKPAPMPTINEDTELKRAYRALGALAMQLASDKPNLMNGNKPNVSQIAEYALNAASDSQGKAPHGYSNTTLRDAIATALNAVNKDLSNR